MHFAGMHLSLVHTRVAFTGALTVLLTCLSCLLFDLSGLLKLVC